MKRLLEWKQRMLQSPLTRKSSRNASRTQTPTNSNSPVPNTVAIGQDSQFRQKVLEELEKQVYRREQWKKTQIVPGYAGSRMTLWLHDPVVHRPFLYTFIFILALCQEVKTSTQGGERRVSRKGSGASRSSRSRSSPRLANRTNNASSSDEGKKMDSDTSNKVFLRVLSF